MRTYEIVYEVTFLIEEEEDEEESSPEEVCEREIEDGLASSTGYKHIKTTEVKKEAGQ